VFVKNEQSIKVYNVSCFVRVVRFIYLIKLTHPPKFRSKYATGTSCLSVTRVHNFPFSRIIRTASYLFSRFSCKIRVFTRARWAPTTIVVGHAPPIRRIKIYLRGILVVMHTRGYRDEGAGKTTQTFNGRTVLNLCNVRNITTVAATMGFDAGLRRTCLAAAKV